MNMKFRIKKDYFFMYVLLSTYTLVSDSQSLHLFKSTLYKFTHKWAVNLFLSNKEQIQVAFPGNSYPIWLFYLQTNILRGLNGISSYLKQLAKFIFNKRRVVWFTFVFSLTFNTKSFIQQTLLSGKTRSNVADSRH